MESTPDIGTSFRVLFPASPLPLGQPQHEAVPQVVSQRHESLVLVVDDEDAVGRLTAHYVGMMGFHAIRAADGVEAVQIFREHADDLELVILDFIMPRLGGAETLAQMKRIRPSVPVILMSGYNEAIAVRDIDGVADFIQKPFAAHELLRVVQNTLQASAPPNASDIH
ncbi:MAG: two-component system cell cycle sensor histidine kinase/response regulator CckA [Planctomycetota bacterium]